ncbi:hypothetical protein [Burkholderia pyrrocinia]|uniref:hypothetical protein n=1 Tax=Burkholderia pyrrocinia TaxID=60550 RepID=UPI0010480FED|nr:hypothetical protein [Burkholderia pyrrocinia]TDA47812.1 hypothetical protein EVG18_08870 [Burkholderia pyrrocinia]
MENARSSIKFAYSASAPERFLDESIDITLRHGNSVSVRRGTRSDADALAALFSATYGDSSHPCQDPVYIRNSIVQYGDQWYIAQLGNRVLGCISVSYHASNRSLEIGHAAVDHSQLRTGIISALLEIGFVNLPTQQSNLVFANVRSMAAYNALTRSVPAVLVGHDGGPDQVRGVREYHLTAADSTRRCNTLEAA